MKQARGQLHGLVLKLEEVLGDGLVGIYLHGSLALGCYNPALSDLDLLVVTQRPLTPEQREGVHPVLARCERLEIHFLAAPSLRPWRHPAPYDAHLGSKGELLGPGEDYDLAAHVTVTRHAGVALFGLPAADILPEVPWVDYEDSLRRDLAWSREHGSKLYDVLSPARIWATLSTGEIHSKGSGAAWALERVPEEWQPVLERALASYRGGGSDVQFDREDVRGFADYVRERLGDVSQ